MRLALLVSDRSDIRAQAQRILRQYDYLITNSDQCAAFCLPMHENNNAGHKLHCRTPSYLQFLLPGENTLISVPLAAFLTLHILAGAILQSPMRAGTAPVQEGPGASS